MTLAESWAGLRKSWLGFKIALSNGDTVLMTHYASFIRRVQTEMGIEVTEFDSNILDEQDSYEQAGNCICEIHDVSQVILEEKSPDHDAIIEDARSKMIDDYDGIRVPRQTIFAGHKTSSENLCKYEAQKLKVKLHAKIESSISATRQSCKYNVEHKGVRTQAKIESWETHEDGSSFHPSHHEISSENEKEDRIRARPRSCVYSVK